MRSYDHISRDVDKLRPPGSKGRGEGARGGKTGKARCRFFFDEPVLFPVLANSGGIRIRGATILVVKSGIWEPKSEGRSRTLFVSRASVRSAAFVARGLTIAKPRRWYGHEAVGSQFIWMSFADCNPSQENNPIDRMLCNSSTLGCCSANSHRRGGALDGAQERRNP